MATETGSLYIVAANALHSKAVIQLSFLAWMYTGNIEMQLASDIMSVRESTWTFDTVPRRSDVRTLTKRSLRQSASWKWSYSNKLKYGVTPRYILRLNSAQVVLGMILTRIYHLVSTWSSTSKTWGTQQLRCMDQHINNLCKTRWMNRKTQQDIAYIAAPTPTLYQDKYRSNRSGKGKWKKKKKGKKNTRTLSINHHQCWECPDEHLEVIQSFEIKNT